MLIDFLFEFSGVIEAIGVIKAISLIYVGWIG